MARTRSMIVDNTIGRIFRNVATVSQANASNLIAGTKIESAIISSTSKAATRPTLNLGNGKGIFFAGGALITQLQLSAGTPPTGTPIIVRLRVGATYATSTEIDQYQLSTRSVTHTVTISVPAGSSVFFDIVQTGSIKPGVGFAVRLNFYRG